MKGYFAYFNVKYFPEMCIDAGFKIGSRILYSEAEYKGQKVYKDINQVRYFIREFLLLMSFINDSYTILCSRDFHLYLFPIL
jgi:hypothetical protein